MLIMTKRLISLAALLPALLQQSAGAQNNNFRPPAVPLIVRNPYLSTWLNATRLNKHWPVFWNGETRGFMGMARIDGKTYRFMGDAAGPYTIMHQSSLKITATRSLFTFEAGGIALHLDFVSPVSPHSLQQQSEPLGLVFASAQSTDGSLHKVSLYFDMTGEWAAPDNRSLITWKRHELGIGSGTLTAYSVQPLQPTVLGEYHDEATWGKALFAAENGPDVTTACGPDTVERAAFAAAGKLNGGVDANMPRAVSSAWPVFAFSFQLGRVDAHSTPPVTLAAGLVQNPAVSYLGHRLPPLWKSYWPTWEKMLGSFYAASSSTLKRCKKLDAAITADASRAAGPHYADICALAFRQAFGATELVGTAKKPWMFMKEISSDGNVSTVDVVYPAYPVFAYSNPHLLRLLLSPLLAYAETGGWPKPFAEHDIGASFPNANGHNDGREEDMPVEESANMLIMFDSVVRTLPAAEAHLYALKHYRILKQWADYEAANAQDPAYQNQTDDFTGFIKSSANLALKGIVGVGAMSQIAEAAGNGPDAARYLAQAHKMIAKWVQLAMSTQKDHLTLAYGHNNTWSLKYNAFPDKALHLDLIPESVLNMEARYYLTKANAFGIPLDGRHTYTKTDWELWTAASTDDAALRSTIVNDIWKFANESPSRAAFTDWYDTISGKQIGFTARPVIGGLFAILVRDGVTLK